MANDKLLSIPLVLPVSAYQFDLFLLMNLQVLSWVGDILEAVENSGLEKPCILVSQWMCTKGRIQEAGGCSVWLVAVDMGTRSTS